MNKLDKLPHLLWINLDRSKDRRIYMENLLNGHKLKNTRIDAYDGDRYEDFSLLANNNIKLDLEKRREIGCLCSHLKALETFIRNDSLGNYCLISEDDLSFEYLPYWKKTFEEYIKSAPRDFSIIQLSLTYAYQYMVHYKNYLDLQEKHEIVKHQPYMYGAVTYLITRNAAINIIKSVKKTINNKYDLSSLLTEPISDCFLYNNNESVYTIPLFTTNTDFVSNIHEEHLNRIHIPSKNIVTTIWKK